MGLLALATVLAASLVRTGRERADLESALAAADTPAEAAGRSVRRGLERLWATLTFRSPAASDEDGIGTGEAAAPGALRHRERVLGAMLALVLAGAAAWSAVTAGPGERGIAIGRSLLWAAVICFGAGVLAPMLTLRTVGEIALLGEVTLSHSTKSLLGAVRALARDGQPGLAALLAALSLLVPALKLSVLLVLAYGARRGHRPEGPGRPSALPPPSGLLHSPPLVRLLESLGRWSMTDVFVVALLVVFLSAEGAARTQATLGPGLWLYAAHALLALAGGTLVLRSTHSPSRPLNPAQPAPY